MGLVFRSDGLVHELCNFVRGIQDGKVEEGIGNKMICSPESMNKILFFNKDKNAEKIVENNLQGVAP